MKINQLISVPCFECFPSTAHNYAVNWETHRNGILWSSIYF